MSVCVGGGGGGGGNSRRKYGNFKLTCFSLTVNYIYIYMHTQYICCKTGNPARKSLTGGGGGGGRGGGRLSGYIWERGGVGGETSIRVKMHEAKKGTEKTGSEPFGLSAGKCTIPRFDSPPSVLPFLRGEVIMDTTAPHH